MSHGWSQAANSPVPSPPCFHGASFTLFTWNRIGAFKPLFKALSLRHGTGALREIGKELEVPQGWTSAPTLSQPHQQPGQRTPQAALAQATLNDFIFSCLIPPTKLPLCFLHSFHEHGHPHCSCPHRKWIRSPSPGGMREAGCLN